jgi:F0F1-type ATP synthase membrane subunit b/b'
VVEERNEFNEIVRQIVEKAKKRKVTAVKKAILKMREKSQRRTEHKSVSLQKKP